MPDAPNRLQLIICSSYLGAKYQYLTKHCFYGKIRGEVVISASFCQFSPCDLTCGISSVSSSMCMPSHDLSNSL